MNIVERLRQSVTKGYEPTDELAIEAADEIERLRGLLTRYQAASYIPEDCDLYAETQAALGHQQGTIQEKP